MGLLTSVVADVRGERRHFSTGTYWMYSELVYIADAEFSDSNQSAMDLRLGCSVCASVRPSLTVAGKKVPSVTAFLVCAVPSPNRARKRKLKTEP